MSLHRRVALPPLALGIHPAPISKKVEKKEGEKKDIKEVPSKLVEKAEKGNPKPDGEGKGDNPKPNIGGEAKGKLSPNPAKPASPVVMLAAGSPVPDSPGSMVPEPPTPGSNAPATPVIPATPAAEDPEPIGAAAVDLSPAAQVPAPQRKTSAAENAHNGNVGNGGDIGKVDKDDKDDKDTKHVTATKDDDEPTPLSPPPPPIRLVGPVPPRPLRTKLDLNPETPYPPLNTDPRGAYYKYAKFTQGEWICVDIPKDGWLADQWREKPEREALARLRGETEKEANREADRIKRLSGGRRVPEKAEEILLQLWNDLVEAVNFECAVGDFWARYDWSDPAAQKHLVSTAPGKEPVGRGGEASDKKGHDDRPTVDMEHTADYVEWTKDGMEEILGTVGVHCSYNATKPLSSRNYFEPAGAYLLRGHGFFMLRTDDYLQFKTEDTAGKFELLVTHGHDRVFGEMVKAQQAEERKKKEAAYREKRVAEKKAAAEAARKEKEGGGEVEKHAPEVSGGDGGKAQVDGEKGGNGGNGGKGTKEERAERPQKGENEIGEEREKKQGKPEGMEGGVASTPAPEAKDQGKKVDPATIQAVAFSGDTMVVAVPVPDGKIGDKGADEKHEAEVIAAAPGDSARLEVAGEARNATAAGSVPGDGGNAGNARADAEPADKAQAAKDPANGAEEIRAKDGKRPFDPMREAELLAKMVAAGQTPPGVGLEDVKLAFKALEAAAAAGTTVGDSKAKEKEKVRVIWTWHDRCETWRWRNFEAKLHEVGPGGWEERDWKVFADDRGCDEYDAEESVIEVAEEDVHDWSC